MPEKTAVAISIAGPEEEKGRPFFKKKKQKTFTFCGSC
jgi:hypothetical protein